LGPRGAFKGEWRRLHNEELYDLLSLPIIIRVTKSRRTRWAENVAHMGTRQVDTRLWWADIVERNHLKDQDVEGIIITELQKVGQGDIGWIYLAHEIDAAVKFRVP